MKSRASRGTGSEGRLSMRFTKRPHGGASPSLHFCGDGLSMSTNGPCLQLSVVFYRSLIGRPSAAALVPLNRTTDKENLFPFSIRILTKWAFDETTRHSPWHIWVILFGFGSVLGWPCSPGSNGLSGKKPRLVDRRNWLTTPPVATVTSMSIRESAINRRLHVVLLFTCKRT